MYRSTSSSTLNSMEPHEILGIPQDASEQRVRAAYKALALKWHPDRQPASKRDEGTAKFVEINRANRTMLRNLHRARRAAEMGSSSAPSSSRSSPQASPGSSSTTLPKFSSDESTTCSSSSRSTSSERSSSSSSHPSCSPSKTSFASCSAAEDEPQPRSTSRRSSPQRQGDASVPGDWDHLSSASTTPKFSRRSRNRKRSTSMDRNSDPIPGNSSPRTLHRQRDATASQTDFGPERNIETLHPVRSILRGAGADVPRKWVHVLNMTLEELYCGKRYYFRVVRHRQSGRKTVVPLEILVSPGTAAGTEIVVEGVGNERKDGTMQTIVFVVNELKHAKFTRHQEDLLMEVRLPWVDSLREETGEVYFHSVDGKEYRFNVDYHADGLLSGTAVIPDAGMPSSSNGGTTRGRVVIRWAISSPHSSWDTLKQILRFKG